MLRDPTHELLDVLTDTVIELMDEVDALRQAQRDRKTEIKDLRRALAEALDPKVYREPETPERRRALERLREHLAQQRKSSDYKPDDPRP